MSNLAHEATDEMGAFAERNRDILIPAPWASDQAYCAGNCNQGRAPCDCRVECLPSAYEDQSQSADVEALIWIIKGLAVLLVVILSASVFYQLVSKL